VSGMAVRRKRAAGGQMDMLQALLGPTDSPLIGAARSERTLMVWSFFALSKEHTTELPVYDDGRIRIEVVGTKHGVATMLDKDVLVYAIGRHRQLDRRLTEVGQLAGLGAALVCDYAASRAPAISAQSSKAWARAAR
jgi:hypothetical protein